MMRIRVFAGPRLVEMADAQRARQIAKAPNAEVVRQRKTGNIVRINLANHGDDSAYVPEHPKGNPRRYSHDHGNQETPDGVWTLRRIPARDRALYRQSVADCLKRAA